MGLIFLGDDRVAVGDITLRYTPSGAGGTPDAPVLVKDRAFIETYQEILLPRAPRRMLEFGIGEGGSALFHTELLGLDRFVGVDISDPSPGFEELLARRHLRARIRPYWATAQDDLTRLRMIVLREFSDGLPDVVIDDASHLYGPSRRSFEIAFPFLRKGGLYVIEDWAWAHWEHTQSPDSGWDRELALTNLIFELVMLLGSADLVRRVEVRQGLVLIEKSEADFDWAQFRLDDLIRSRGRRPSPI